MVLQTAKDRIPYDPEILLLRIGYLPRRIKNWFPANTFMGMLIAALVTIAKKWKQHRSSSTNERITKCGIVIQWNSIWPLKRSEVRMHTTTWMNLRKIILKI